MATRKRAAAAPAADSAEAPRVSGESALTVVGMAPSVTPDQLALIKRTVAKGATDDELKLYLYDCQRRGVHPLDKLIHFAKFKNTYTPLTSIDFLRARAGTTGEMAGSDEPQFEYDGDNRIMSATVTVYRMVAGQRCPFRAKARWDEYVPKGGERLVVWLSMPHVMLGKCAEALALRKAFPAELGSLYVTEELERDPAPVKGKAGVVKSKPEPVAEQSQPATTEKSPVERARAAWFASLQERLKERGVLWRGARYKTMTDPQMRAYVSDCLKRDIKTRSDLSVDDWKHSLSFIKDDRDPGQEA